MIALLLRLLLAIAVVWLAIYLVRRLTRKSEHKNTDADDQSNQQLHTCAHCGIYVPESDVIESEGKYYCSQSHLDQDQKN